MKKGHDVKEMLNSINEDTKNKRDYLVDMKSIKVETNTMNGDAVSPFVYPSISVDHLTTGSYVLTDHSLNQLCGKLEIGTQYLRKCLPVSQELVAHNLNFWIN